MTPSTSLRRSAMQNPTRPIQREAILGMLRAAGPDGLCSLAAYHRGPGFYNSRNRVSELGHDGYVIRSDRCQHDETTPSHVRWTLTREPNAGEATRPPKNLTRSARANPNASPTQLSLIGGR